MWYLPAFVYMRVLFVFSHHVGNMCRGNGRLFECLHMLIMSNLWLTMPCFVDTYIGWTPPAQGQATVCPSECWCPFQVHPEAQTVLYYVIGWWNAGLANSFLGHGLIFIPCYWIGFYGGKPVFGFLTKLADEPNWGKRFAVVAVMSAIYWTMFKYGTVITQGYDDRCGSFWPGGHFNWVQIPKNVLYFVMNLSMSLLYVVLIAAVVPVHLKYLAKICFSALICSAYTPCILDFTRQAWELRQMLPAWLSPSVELTWVFAVPFLYELVTGAIIGVILPVIAKAVIAISQKVRG